MTRTKKRRNAKPDTAKNRLKFYIVLLSVAVIAAALFTAVKIKNTVEYNSVGSHSSESEKKQYSRKFLGEGKSLNNITYSSYLCGKDLNPGRDAMKEFMEDYDEWYKSEKLTDESFESVTGKNYVDDSTVSSQILNVTLNCALNPLREDVDSKSYDNSDIMLLKEMYGGKLKCEYDAYCKLLDALESYGESDEAQAESLIADTGVLCDNWDETLKFYCEKYNIKYEYKKEEKPFAKYRATDGDGSATAESRGNAMAQ